MEQIYNENNQNNTVRNLLIFLLVAVVGLGAFMVYDTYYKEEAKTTTATADNNASQADGSAMTNKMSNWLENNYERLTPESRMMMYGVGMLLVGRLGGGLYRFGQSIRGCKTIKYRSWYNPLGWFIGRKILRK